MTEAIRNTARQRYEMVVEDSMTYARTDGRIALAHTEVPSALAGCGVGSALARPVLEDGPFPMRVFGVVGGCAAKMGIVQRLVAELSIRGLRVSTIKRTPDDLDLDRPGTGSWGHREAGAQEVMLASGTRQVLMREVRSDEVEPDIDALLACMMPVDLVLLEGFRLSPYPKLEATRPGQDRRLLALDDPSVLAITGDAPIAAPVPFLPLSNMGVVADFVVAHAAKADRPN